ncbi:MAG: hypothetical protein H0X73_08870 [Chthoniobacterales bacterium]|nr:hypothetical protein [Chthoniobacterales bacterium]
MFTLEAIGRGDRKAFFAKYAADIKTSVDEQPDGSIRIRMTVGSDDTAHPGNNPYLSSHLADALRIGCKLMRCPRVGGVQNPDLRKEWLAANRPNLQEQVDLFAAVGRQIESRGAGIASVKAIGARYASPDETWTKGLGHAPLTDDSVIARAVAEWADGDSVSAHVAYGNDFFCTRDVARSSGGNSVFSEPLRTWLSHEHGVRFMTPKELAAVISP